MSQLLGFYPNKTLAQKAQLDVGYIKRVTTYIHVGNKNFIEINGKKYDATTGRMLDNYSDTVSSANPTAVVTFKMNSGIVDGFTRRPKTNPSVSRTQARPVSKQAQKSQTLVRSTVLKPASVYKTLQSSKPQIYKSHLGASVKRSEASRHVPKSEHIQKYSTTNHRSLVAQKNVAVLPFKEQTPASEKQVSIHGNFHSVQAQKPLNHKTQSHINRALENAHSHEQVHHGKESHHFKHRGRISHKLGISKKASTISAGVLAAVLLVGFFTIQNVPNLSMRIAATRAGFDAQMPGYQPSGFSFKGPINYSPGQVTVSFGSNSDGRFYDVKQRASNWNSDALLSNFVVAEGKTYQTYLDKGRTLFIYDGSNATWVDNGVWYQVEGDSDMTTDQLIRIASSI